MAVELEVSITVFGFVNTPEGRKKAAHALKVALNPALTEKNVIFDPVLIRDNETKEIIL